MKNEKIELYDPNNDNQLALPLGADEPVEDLIYEFLKDRGIATEEAYQRDLRAFFKFTRVNFALPRAKGMSMAFEEIRRVHVVKYKKYLEGSLSNRKRPFAPNTINRKISAVSSFFQFLLQREIIEKNPAEFCKRPNRIVMEETQAFSDREMKTLFDLIIDKAPPLHKASILLLFTTGMRQAELRNLKLGNFVSREGIRFVNYIGKGQKMNQIPIHPTTAHYLDEYESYHVEKVTNKELSLGESNFPSCVPKGTKTGGEKTNG